MSAFTETTDALTGGCGCACHTGVGYRTSCEHCGSAPRTHQDGQQAAVPTETASDTAAPAVDAQAIARDHALYVPLREADVWDMPRCANCLDYWRGDADTGGCTARLLALRVIEMEALLRDLEHPPRSHERELFDLAADLAAARSRIAELTGLLRRLHGTADEALRLLDMISRVRAEHVLDDPDGAWPIVRSDLRGVLEQARVALGDAARATDG